MININRIYNGYSLMENVDIDINFIGPMKKGESSKTSVKKD